MRWTFIFIVLVWTAISQSQPYPFITYTPKDGLVSARVRNAYQDSKGRIHFLTYGGLSVYDGVRFKNYTMRDGLGSDMVNDVIEIGHDSLLIATNSSLYLNLLIRNRVEKYPLEAESIPMINKLLMDEDGIVYMTADQGLFRLDSNELYKFELPQFTRDILPYLGTLCDAGPYLLFTTNDLKNYQGLYLFDKESEVILDFIPDIVVHDLIRDPDGRIWVLSMNHLVLIDTPTLQQGKLRLLDSKLIYPDLDEKILRIAFSNEESWIIYPDNRFEIHSHKGESIMMDLPILKNMGGLNSAMVDRERILWICTNGSGVIKISKPQFTVLQQKNKNESDIPIAHVTATPEGTWYHSFDGHIYSGSVGELNLISENLPPPAHILGSIRDTLYARDENTLYAAAKSSGQSLDFSPVFHLEDTSFFFGAAIIDPYDGVYSGTPSGLIHIRNGKSLLVYPMPDVDLIEVLSIDHEGFLWMISRHSDIVRFAFTPDVPGHITVSKIFPIHHLQISPRAAAIDEAGHLWIGSRSHGIYVCDMRGDSIKIVNRFDTKSGLTDNFITCLRKCPDGSMLAGTQTGLDRIIPFKDDQYRIENLTKRSDYFAFIWTIWAGKEGKTFALTNTGKVIEVYPVDKNPFMISPQLLIDEVKVNGAAILPGKEVFGHQENNFVINISAPTFIDEKQVRYSYRLEGGSKSEWSESSPAQASIHLLNLSPGNYTLHLRATFPSTFYPTAESLYHFTIRPAWWQTTLSRIALIVLLFIITGMVMYLFYKRKLERQQAILEKQHAIQEERSRISGDLHDDLGAGLSTIRFLVEKIKQDNELIPKAPLDRIQDTSDELTDKMNEIIWAMSEKHDTLGDLLSYTRSFIATYCDEHWLSCHFQFPQVVPNTFVSGQIRRNVFLIIKESLHNILKHSNASNVYIDIRLNNNLEISIRDDGKGVADQVLNQKSGHGLRNMQKRISILGGTFSVTNNPGAVVEFSVPLSQSR